MNDLISRQAAIDAVNRLSLGETDAVRLSMRIADYLNRIPPAQPERKKGNEKCSNELPCGWCSLFDTPCFGRGGERQ